MNTINMNNIRNENIFTSYNISIWNYNIIKSLCNKWKNYGFDNRFIDCKKMLELNKFAKKWNNKTIREESKNLLSFKLNMIESDLNDYVLTELKDSINKEKNKKKLFAILCKMEKE